MFDFDALEKFEQGLQKAESLSVRDRNLNDAAVVARTEELLDLSNSLYKRSKRACIEGLHG